MGVLMKKSLVGLWGAARQKERRGGNEENEGGLGDYGNTIDGVIMRNRRGEEGNGGWWMFCGIGTWL